MFFKIGCFENFGKIARKNLCGSIFLILYFWIQRDIFPDELICRITPLFKDAINHLTAVTKKKIQQILLIFSQQKYIYLEI